MQQSDKLRLLLLSDDMQIGGVPRHVVDLANGLVERNVHVTVAATEGPMSGLLKPAIRFLNLKLTRQDFRKKRLLNVIPALSRLLRYSRENKISIVHSHKRYSDILGRVVATSVRIPHISTCHNTFSDHRALSVFGQRTIACSERIRDNLTEHYKKDRANTRTIYYGLRSFKGYGQEERRRTKEAFGITSFDATIGCIASFDPRKDHRTLVQALNINRSLLAKKKAVVLLVGEGQCKEKMQQTVRGLDLDRHVRFLPSDSDIEKVVNCCDFFVLPSLREGLPYVLLEAASVGKPHIASRIDGIPEFIRHGETGLLFKPGNAQDLATQMELLLTNPGSITGLGDRAQQTVQQMFGYDRFIDEHIGIYSQVRGD